MNRLNVFTAWFKENIEILYNEAWKKFKNLIDDILKKFWMLYNAKNHVIKKSQAHTI